MARTQILPSDPNKRKAWSAKVAQDSVKEMYFSRLIGEEGTASAIIRKVDTEAGSKSGSQGGNGDEVTRRWSRSSAARRLPKARSSRATSSACSTRRTRCGSTSFATA